jgi:hypothetical protein
MTTLRNASLVLKTSDFAINTSNNYGFCDSVKARITWNNINLRSLLGDMYDKYDTFNLCLNTVSSGVSQNYYYASPSDLQVLLRIQGLPFLNNTYNIQLYENQRKYYE